ncbi:MAG TPA: PepSY domain-containing protein [Chthoniobacterales bacterium]|nr:PepSY domain-containing protein [Chthoniobacterales bacterium]
MKMKHLLLTAAVSAGLMFGVSAQGGEHKGEVVDQKTLPAAVQKTITEKAAGGEIVRVQREDDKDGKWNYEVIVKTDGKEWGFEVDPNGKFVKKHDDHHTTDKH